MKSSGLDSGGAGIVSSGIGKGQCLVDLRFATANA
jgi:hypothetical protein